MEQCQEEGGLQGCLSAPLFEGGGLEAAVPAPVLSPRTAELKPSRANLFTG